MDEPTWDLARGNLLSLPDSGLADSLELVITVTVPEHQVTASGSLWFLAAGRRDRLTSSFGRDAHGNERPLP